MHGIKRREKESKKISCMKSRRFFRQKISGGKGNTQTSLDGEGEAGIFYIARSDLCRKMQTTCRGNRIMFGSISVILLCVGLVNYFNIMFTGIVGREKRTGDYEKDWNDTPAGKKAVIAGRQLLCTAYRRPCSVSWINHTKRNQRLYEKTAFLFYLSLSGRSDCRKYCNSGNSVRYNL